MKRWLLFFTFPLLLGLFMIAQAQDDDTTPYEIALDLVHERVGRTTFTDSSSFSIQNFTDTALGCTQSAPEITSGYIRGWVFTFYKQSIVYDVRVSQDGRIAFICSPAFGITPTLLPTATSIPTRTPTPVLPTPTPAGCSNLSSRLTIGQQGRVTPGLPNNVRAQPGESSQYVGEIAPGTVFTVLEGPRCASGLAWWQIDYNGLIGWTPEGKGEDYWLEPVGTPALVPAFVTNTPRP
jgi:hypothetical protein